VTVLSLAGAAAVFALALWIAVEDNGRVAAFDDERIPYLRIVVVIVLMLIALLAIFGGSCP